MVRLSLAGYSQRVIARSVGVSAMTVNRVLKRLEEAEDGAPELRMDAPVPVPVAEDLEPEEQEAEAGAMVIGPDTLGEARSPLKAVETVPLVRTTTFTSSGHNRGHTQPLPRLRLSFPSPS